MSVTRSDTSVSIDFEGAPVSSANPLPVEATIEVSDIEIGAVELKDAASANRATINAGGELLTRDHAEVAGTATLANVNDSASSGTLQAANANRLGWSVFNDSDKDLMVKFGATASATSFTVKVPAGGYYEMPKPIYTGVIDGIWTADSTGAARVTELTA